MKINGYGIQGLNPYSNTKRTVSAQENKASFTDKLEISSAAQEMKVTSELTAGRAEKVKKLKADIETGNYKVDADRVARDMLKYFKF